MTWKDSDDELGEKTLEVEEKLTKESLRTERLMQKRELASEIYMSILENIEDATAADALKGTENFILYLNTIV